MKNNIYKYLGFALLVILLNYAITNFSAFSNSFGFIYTIIRPIVIGCIIAYFVWPLVRLTEKIFFKRIKYRRIGYYCSVIISYLLIILILYLIGYFLTPIIIDSISKITNLDYNNLYHSLNNSWQGFQEKHQILSNIDLIDALKSMYEGLTSAFTNLNTQSFLKTFLGITTGIYAYIMGFILSIYLIISKDSLFKSSDRFFSVIFNEKHYHIIKKYFLLFEETFKKFFFGKMFDSLIIGIIAFVGLAIIKAPFYPLLAIIIMVTNMIPYFGPFIGGIPAVLVSLFVTGNPMLAIIVALFVLLLQQFDGIYLGPKILGDSVGIKSVWVLISIIIGGALFKVTGLLLCVPFAATFKVAFDEFYRYRMAKRTSNEK